MKMYKRVRENNNRDAQKFFDSFSVNKQTYFFSSLGRIGSMCLFFFIFFFILFFSFFLFDCVVENNKVFTFVCGEWFSFRELEIEWSFFFDDVTVYFLFFILLISFFVFLFSFWYLGEDPFFITFLFFLSLFVCSMLLLVSANNLILLFVGWEGVGICSFLLINFWHYRKTALKSALLALFLNKIGDFFFFLFCCCIFFIFNTFDLSLILALSDITFYYGLEEFGCLCCFCLFFCASIKSAQLGFHIWLPEAMEGPTPVSALLHAATMVTAGVYLLLRFWFFFEYFPVFSLIICLIGVLTCFFGTLLCLVVNDIKKVVAFSTCGQLGYMFVSCGFFNHSFAFFHLCSHALFKALLFLIVGSIIYSFSNEQDLRKLGGLGHFFPFHVVIFFLCSLNLVGIPFVSGFFSKEKIIFSVFSMVSPFFIIDYSFFFSLCFFLLLFSIFFSISYCVKLIWYLFFDIFRGRMVSLIHFSFPKYLMCSFFFLSMLSVFFGYFFFSFFEVNI